MINMMYVTMAITGDQSNIVLSIFCHCPLTRLLASCEINTESGFRMAVSHAVRAAQRPL